MLQKLRINYTAITHSETVFFFGVCSSKCFLLFHCNMAWNDFCCWVGVSFQNMPNAHSTKYLLSCLRVVWDFMRYRSFEIFIYNWNVGLQIYIKFNYSKIISTPNFKWNPLSFNVILFFVAKFGHFKYKSKTKQCNEKSSTAQINF